MIAGVFSAEQLNPLNAEPDPMITIKPSIMHPQAADPLGVVAGLPDLRRPATKSVGLTPTAIAAEADAWASVRLTAPLLRDTTSFIQSSLILASAFTVEAVLVALGCWGGT
jgi:hypothetical protein